MHFWQYHILAMLIGFGLDLLLGDPAGWPHPVIWIGKYIAFAEKRLRRSGIPLRRAAILLTATTVLLTMAITAVPMALLWHWGPVPYVIGASVVAWLAISAKCLAKEALGVERALGQSLEAGRRQVSRIVGRDTRSLSREEILRATVETVAENTTDGVIAPLFYLFLGGPVLAMGFKAASTLDSMVGYLDEIHRDIGWSSARLDDIFNFIPARICGVLLCVAARFGGMDGANALRILRRDHANHLSPNCAWSEAAVAGALHVQLGGTHSYFGKQIEKPTIGDADREITLQDIRRTVRLLYITSIFMVVLLGIVSLIR